MTRNPGKWQIAAKSTVVMAFHPSTNDLYSTTRFLDPPSIPVSALNPSNFPFFGQILNHTLHLTADVICSTWSKMYKTRVDAFSSLIAATFLPSFRHPGNEEPARGVHDEPL